MGFNRIVNSSFWTDNKIDKFSLGEKCFMFYLLSNPYSTLSGIYEVNVSQFATQLGFSEEYVRLLLESFDTQYGIIYRSKTTEEIAIKNFLRYSIIKGGPAVYYCLKNSLNRVKDRDLIAKVFSHLKTYTDLNVTVIGLIMEYERCGLCRVPTHCENPKISTNSIKIPMGKYKNVLLAEEERADLIKAYGEDLTQKAIDYLDSYIEENKKTKPDYVNKDHYVCINRWVIVAVKEQEEKRIKKESKKTQNRYGDFDVNASFEQALKRSYGNMDTE